MPFPKDSLWFVGFKIIKTWSYAGWKGFVLKLPATCIYVDAGPWHSHPFSGQVGITHWCNTVVPEVCAHGLLNPKS